MKYLHETAPGIFWLDHRLVPEVKGMLAAMSSRAPVGGVRARYAQIVEAVAEGLFCGDEERPHEHVSYPDGPRPKTWADACKHPHAGAVDVSFTYRTIADHYRVLAEDRLCEYPLHPRVQKFFDDFVGKYGHSSILELVT